jgi:hypothetical protein
LNLFCALFFAFDVYFLVYIITIGPLASEDWYRWAPSTMAPRQCGACSIDLGSHSGSSLTRIKGVAEQLEAAYDGLQDAWGGGRDEFVRMTVADGCFFLLETAWAILHATGGTAGAWGSSHPSKSKPNKTCRIAKLEP